MSKDTKKKQNLPVAREDQDKQVTQQERITTQDLVEWGLVVTRSGSQESNSTQEQSNTAQAQEATEEKILLVQPLRRLAATYEHYWPCTCPKCGESMEFTTRDPQHNPITCLECGLDMTVVRELPKIEKELFSIWSRPDLASGSVQAKPRRTVEELREVKIVKKSSILPNNTNQKVVTVRYAKDFFSAFWVEGTTCDFCDNDEIQPCFCSDNSGTHNAPMQICLDCLSSTALIRMTEIQPSTQDAHTTSTDLDKGTTSQREQE